MVRKVQKEKLHVAFLTAYPSEQAVDRPRTQAARDVAREASGTSDSSDVDMDADTDDVEEDLDPLEELEEERNGKTRSHSITIQKRISKCQDHLSRMQGWVVRTQQKSHSCSWKL